MILESLNQNDEIESVTPMSDRPHPRTIARQAVAKYRADHAPQHLTQASIDKVQNRTTVDYTRRSIRYHRVSLLRKFLNLFL